jgi:hypothetical protein
MDVKLAAFNHGPQYTHDCDKCEFLCRIGTYDVYICAASQSGTNTIVRYGNEGSQYTSGTVWKGKTPNA